MLQVTQRWQELRIRSSLEMLSGPTLLPDGREWSSEATSKDDTGENWKPGLVTEEDFSRSGQYGKAAGRGG